MGVLSREKHPLQQLHSKKGGGRIFEGGFIFGRLRYVPSMLDISADQEGIICHRVTDLFEMALTKK